ncbi:MAG: sulfatase-like hydrolase/transferase, partial [Candidatus Glassbacteria bacterium]|nr:sulfatase-like hydrolase/transferase [Candidatus Glassbacteria bacterium]
NFFDNDPILSREGKAVQTLGESSAVTVEAAIEFMRKHAAGSRPFLALVWFGSPHQPHQALEQDRAPYSGLEESLQHFYGEITGMDRAFGMLRNELRALGIHRNTILWYCSDNGGLAGIGSTGGRGHKAEIYEGGLRVPALLEWPDRLPGPGTTAIPCNTEDIYPTLLEITGVQVENQPPLDGISLVPLLDGKMKARPKPMGFWDYPVPGIGTPSKQWMTELLQAQRDGSEVGDSSRLRLEAGEISGQYPEDSFPGHAAWLDWPWKLHRIQDEDGGVRFELYNLADDPREQDNVLDRQQRRAESMKSGLNEWQESVVRSLNGRDYL